MRELKMRFAALSMLRACFAVACLTSTGGANAQDAAKPLYGAWGIDLTAMDPQVISQLLAHSSRDKPLARLTRRELEVLELMAQGSSNTAIASRLVITERAIGKHTSNIFSKLGLPPSDDQNRRVLAVLAYLNQT